MIDTCSYPRVYKNSGGGPYLIDLPQCDTTRLSFAVSMLGDRFGGAECLSANLLAPRLLPPRWDVARGGVSWMLLRHRSTLSRAVEH